MSMVKMRIALEKRIVSTIVKDAIKAGYRLGVSLERGYDHETMLIGSTDVKKTVEEAMAGDESHLFIQPKDGALVDENGSVISIGWVFFVFGNDGWDVVSDYTTNLDKLGILDRANAIAEREGG